MGQGDQKRERLTIVIGVPEEESLNNVIRQVTVLLDFGLAGSALLRRESGSVISTKVRAVLVATGCDPCVAD